MIRRSTRYLTPAERAANQTTNPFHVLFRTKKWQERKEAVVEILEFRVDKAWSGSDSVQGCAERTRSVVCQQSTKRLGASSSPPAESPH